jgi:hypothetical protein
VDFDDDHTDLFPRFITFSDAKPSAQTAFNAPINIKHLF